MAQVSRFPLLAPTKSRSPLISSGSRSFTSSLLPARGGERTLHKNHKYWHDFDFKLYEEEGMILERCVFDYRCKKT